MQSNVPDLSGRRVLVTGGTGFMGGRLVERLITQCGASVRVLVRNFSRAPRIARFPIDMIAGDLIDADAVSRAMEGCDLVFHCGGGVDGDEAYQRSNLYDGTVHVLEAARQAGVKRVVNISTVSVYGSTPDGDLDETSPQPGGGDVYSDSKLDAERIALEYCNDYGVPVVILQPTIVYGPFGTTWTQRILNDVANSRSILINGGDGLCNAVYVDDVVTAMLLAAVKDGAVGETFLISGEEPVTWKEFYAAHERLLGVEGTVNMSAAEAMELFKSLTRKKSIFAESRAIVREEVAMRRRVRGTAEVTALIDFARRVVPRPVRQSIKRRLTGNHAGDTGAEPTANGHEEEKPLLPLPPGAIDNNAAKTRVRIDKAKRILGYQPAFDFEAGMARVAEWARWANLLPAEEATSR